MIKKTLKLGQFKIQQMAFMLIAVVIFFALVGIFVLGYGLSGLKQTANLLEEQNAMLLVSKLANSPEFSCGEAFGVTRINCIDFDKVMMLKQDIKKYNDFWGVSNIEIRKTVGGEQETLCNLANYPNCNTLKLLEQASQGYDYSNFVSLCWKEKSTAEIIYDKCAVAKLIVRYKEKI
ncbi:MAG: hypothetical protein AABY15_03655 [Nanoarchaeota archaeon]